MGSCIWALWLVLEWEVVGGVGEGLLGRLQGCRLESGQMTGGDMAGAWWARVNKRDRWKRGWKGD